MAWVAIPNSDIDGDSPLKMTSVLRQLRDNWDAVFAGTSPLANRVGLQSAYLVNRPAGYIRTDGNPSGQPRCVIAPVEVSDIFIFDEDTSWTPPLGVRQMIIEMWGAGAGTNGGISYCGGYCLKLVDVSSGPVEMTMGVSDGGISTSSSPGARFTTVRYGGITVQARGGEVPVVGTVATSGDINIIGGGVGPAVRGGGFDSVTGKNSPGGACCLPQSVIGFGGPGRVVIRSIG